MTDPKDSPEPDGMELVVPFIACQSKGGPYDDDSFVAGFLAGQVDKALTAAAAVGATRFDCTVPTVLVPQLELVGMYRGFPVATAVQVVPGGHELGWSFVQFGIAPGGAR
jgi:hypothetical protein